MGVERADIPCIGLIGEPIIGELIKPLGPEIIGGGDGAHGEGGRYWIGEGEPRLQPRGGWFCCPDILFLG